MENKAGSSKVFSQRLDFYVHSILVYLGVLVIYAIGKGLLLDGHLGFEYKDPITILLSSIILISAFSFLLKYWRNRTIIIGEDYIIFKTRFREKKYLLSDIDRIFLGKVRKLQLRETYRIIKIGVKGRKRMIRIRPTGFWDDMELYKAISELNKKLRALNVS